jgi:glycosyltransferase involved in cell wall biosynthesis
MEEKLEILILGGIYSADGRFNNAVFCLSEQLSEINNVKILPISRFPWNEKKPSKSSSRIIHFNRLILLLKSFKYFFTTYYSIKPYINIFSVYGVVLFFRFLFNMTSLEILLKDYNPDIVHIHSTDLERFAFYKVMFNKKIPFFTTIHGLYSFDENFDNAYDAKKLEKNILNKLNKQKRPIIFVARGVKDCTVQKFGLDDFNLHVISNGVNQKSFKKLKSFNKDRVLKKYNIPQGKKIIIQVGNLYKIKNHIVVLEAISRMESDLRSRLHYLVVGDGFERSKLEKFSNDYHITDTCSFVGKKFGIELVELYGVSDFLIVPSTSENFPLVFLEALAMGIPIITFKDLWPVKDFFNKNYMELINERSIDAIIHAIEMACYRKWDTNLIISISKEYSWSNVSYKYNNLFKSILSGDYNEK